MPAQLSVRPIRSQSRAVDSQKGLLPKTGNGLNGYDYTKGTFIECNTAYDGNDLQYTRSNTKNHTNLLNYHGWLKNGRRTIIMDENPDKNFNLTVKNYTKIPNNIVGEHIKDFDSVLVLAHFKGHGAGGFGGALKQLSIGFASQAGKTNI